MHSHKGIIISPRELKGLKYISIGKNTIVGEDAILTALEKRGDKIYSPEIIIGDNCCLGEHIHISAINKIEIGNNVLTGRYVYISDNNHGGKIDLAIPPALRSLSSKGPVKIGNNVWIGERVCILSGVTIGDNSVIAANSVVTHNVPPFSIAGGVPAIILTK